MPLPQIDLTDLPVERAPLATLRPDPKNARAHNERNLTAIRASLEAFGQRKPLVTDKTGKTVIAGNGTLEVMAELGWESAWITRFPGTVAEARAYAVADNRTGDLAGWDETLLAENLRQISADDLLHAVAWEQHEIQNLLAGGYQHPAEGGSHGASAPAGQEVAPPVAFTAYDDDIHTDHQCPKCGYEWS